MNIDFTNDEVVECVKIGMDSGTMLEDNTYLIKLREVFQKHGIRKVWAQGAFYGKRGANIRLWIEGIEINRKVEQDLAEIMETYEYITGGKDKKCKYFPRLTMTGVHCNKEVIYDDGVFYANGYFGLVQKHRSTENLDVAETSQRITQLLRSLGNEPVFYSLQKVYRLSVSLFSKLGCIDYACPEYVDVVYPYMRDFRRFVVWHENRCTEPSEDEIEFLQKEILPNLRKDVLEAHER